MQRIHISISVTDLDASVRFYTSLFGTPPSKVKSDYAKWMLDDPRVNFSVSTCCGAAGVSHLGIQVDSEDEMAVVAERLAAARYEVGVEDDVTCCYARQTKAWARDPQGVPWETFLTHGDSAAYGDAA